MVTLGFFKYDFAYNEQVGCIVNIIVKLVHNVEVARAPGAICRRSAHKYAVPSNHV